MELKIVNQDFSICKVADLSQIDYSDKFFFICKTDEELSLVCSTNLLPKNTIESDNGWKAFRIQGVLDFSLIGLPIIFPKKSTKVSFSIVKSMVQEFCNLEPLIFNSLNPSLVKILGASNTYLPKKLTC